MKILVYNNGCIREEALAKKLRNDIKSANNELCYKVMDADIIIYITCAGVKKTIIECVQDISAFLTVKRSDTKFIITGCLTKLDDIFREISTRDDIFIIKNPDFIVPTFNIINNENKRNSMKTKLENRTRFMYNSNTFVQFFLCNGCTNNCSFCKGNYLKEPIESIPYDIALNYLKSLVASGTRVITLTGENLTLFGIDLYGKPMLHEFIKDLCKIPNLEYITINEVTIQNMYPELLEVLCSEQKVKSVGIQIETASNRLLKLMNRNHDYEKMDYCIGKLTDAGKFITTVLMSGFPTETFDDLDFTISYLRKRNIYTELLCEYNDFELIPSSKLPQFNFREKRKHTIYLKNALNETNKEALIHKIIDTRKSIIIAKSSRKVYVRNFFNGYTIKKVYQDANLGDVIETPAYGVVHLSKSKIGYEYRH